MNLLVIARHEENLAWTAHLPHGWHTIVVQKGVDMPNAGREPASFALAADELVRTGRNRAAIELVAFVQGNPFAHCADLFHCLTDPWPDDAGFRWLGDPHLSGASGEPHDSGLPVKELYEQLVGKPFPGEVYFAAGGQFMCRTDLLEGVPWAKLVDLACLNRNAWAFERLWESIICKGA